MKKSTIFRMVFRNRMFRYSSMFFLAIALAKCTCFIELMPTSSLVDGYFNDHVIDQDIRKYKGMFMGPSRDPLFSGTIEKSLLGAFLTHFPPGSDVGHAIDLLSSIGAECHDSRFGDATYYRCKYTKVWIFASKRNYLFCKSRWSQAELVREEFFYELWSSEGIITDAGVYIIWLESVDVTEKMNGNL